MVTIARKSPVNDPRRSPVQFVKGIINKGRRTPTKELDNRSNPGIDIFCDESIAPQVKSVRTNNSRRNEQVAAPGSPSKRRSQRIERNRQRVIVENASTNKPKSRDRLPEYSNIPGASFIKTTRSPQTTPSRDQSRSPVIHVVETKSLSPRPAKSRHSTTKRAHERRKSQREGSPTSVMEKALDRGRRQQKFITRPEDEQYDNASNSILANGPPASAVLTAAQEKSKESAENETKRVSWHRGVKPCDDESSNDGTYDDMTVDTAVSYCVCACPPLASPQGTYSQPSQCYSLFQHIDDRSI